MISFDDVILHSKFPMVAIQRIPCLDYPMDGLDLHSCYRYVVPMGLKWLIFIICYRHVAPMGLFFFLKHAQNSIS